VAGSVRNRIQRQLLLMAVDAVLLILCSMVSMWIVYAAYDATVVLFTVIASLILLLSLSLTRFYLIRVSEGSLDLVNRAFTGFLLPSLVSILIPVFLEGYHSSWIPYFVVFWGSSFLCILGVRFAYRSFRTYYTKQTHNNNPRTVIYGAGELGNRGTPWCASFSGASFLTIFQPSSTTMPH